MFFAVPHLPLDFLLFPPYFPFSLWAFIVLSSLSLAYPGRRYHWAEEKPLSHICIALLLLVFPGSTFAYPIFHSEVTAWPQHSTFSSHRCFYQIHACFLETWQKESFYLYFNWYKWSQANIQQISYPVFVFLNICFCFSIYMKKGCYLILIKKK